MRQAVQFSVRFVDDQRGTFGPVCKFPHSVRLQRDVAMDRLLDEQKMREEIAELGSTQECFPELAVGVHGVELFVPVQREGIIVRGKTGQNARDALEPVAVVLDPAA